MDYYSQNDPRWKNTKFRDCARSTLGKNGCLLASLCNARKKFYPNEDYSPMQASKDWVFVIGKDKEKHWLDWVHTDFPGFSFVSRIRCSGVDGERKFGDDDRRKIVSMIQSPDLAVGIEVLTKSGERHWLMAKKGFVFGGIKCVDSWPDPANVPAQTWGFLGRYVRPTGWVVIRKKP